MCFELFKSEEYIKHYKGSLQESNNISPCVVLITECITNTCCFCHLFPPPPSVDCCCCCCCCCRCMLCTLASSRWCHDAACVSSSSSSQKHLSTGLTTFTLVTPRWSTERRVLHRLQPPRLAPPQHINSQPTYHCRADDSSNKKKMNGKRNKAHHIFRRRRRT